jgi:spore coat assembly protein SafA
MSNTVGASSTVNDSELSADHLAANPSSSVARSTSFDLAQTALDDVLHQYDEVPSEKADTAPLPDQAEPAPVPPNGAPVPSSGDAPVHTVIPGDTLWQIARDNNVSLDALIAANPQFDNPDLIFPGDKVTIPSSQQTTNDGEPTVQATTLTNDETADEVEATQVGSLTSTPTEENQRFDWVESSDESIAQAQQMFDQITAANTAATNIISSN